ncbi:MAG: hypothetical protein JO025_05765 [Verrucomicrobia bacterium]|nr:hypothetical protein [Verrucomicrobiota bacterium]
MTYADRTLLAPPAEPAKDKAPDSEAIANSDAAGEIRSGAAAAKFPIWAFGCPFAFLGVLVAALSKQPLFWLIVWPWPVVLVCTIVIFVRQGFHFENGVLVLGRKRD